MTDDAVTAEEIARMREAMIAARKRTPLEELTENLALSAIDASAQVDDLTGPSLVQALRNGMTRT